MPVRSDTSAGACERIVESLALVVGRARNAAAVRKDDTLMVQSMSSADDASTMWGMPEDERMRRVLLPVKNEAAAVVAEMRLNKRWAASPASVSVVRCHLASCSLVPATTTCCTCFSKRVCR
jgi:hypothetical protein